MERAPTPPPAGSGIMAYAPLGTPSLIHQDRAYPIRSVGILLDVPLREALLWAISTRG